MKNKTYPLEVNSKHAIYKFQVRVTDKAVEMQYLWQKDKQSGKTITTGIIKWEFSSKTTQYEIALACIAADKENNKPEYGTSGNSLAHFTWNCYHMLSMAQSSEIYNIAVNAINEAVKQKEAKDVAPTEEKKVRRTNKKAKDGAKYE